MISFGLNLGEPEQHGNAFNRAFNRIGTATGEVDEPGEWEGKVPSVHVNFCIPGSILAYDDVHGITPVRFSRKQKRVLVTVRVPADILDDFGRSFEFIIDALHKAIELAADVFSRKANESLDVAKAHRTVDRNKLYRTDEKFRKRIDSKILPGG